MRNEDANKNGKKSLGKNGKRPTSRTDGTRKMLERDQDHLVQRNVP
jgi:hypothetical protein